jgi:type 1 glutamine amidotransferase
MKRLLAAILLLEVCLLTAQTPAADKKIVLLAGSASHGHGEHEHRAGCLLLRSCLEHVPGVCSIVCSNGWPKDPEAAFADAATVVLYSDGGGGHPFLPDARLARVGKLMEQGVGLVCIHYAVEPTKERGEKEFLDWIGGCFELDWSVNPSWDADFRALADHPITHGVKPFKLHDEWYFHMRFREDMKGIVPILSAVPPQSTMNRGDGPHEGNPAVREAVNARQPQHMAWAYERANGGRGFGFTGGHYYRNWGDENFRKIVLNAILWTAHVEVPAEGVQCAITPEELNRNLDAK